MSWILRITLVLIVILSMEQPVRGATPPGTTIDNTARVQFSQRPDGPSQEVHSNLHSNVVIPLPTPAAARFLRYQPGASGASGFLVGTTQYSTSGTDQGPFQPMPGPVVQPGRVPIDMTAPVDLLQTDIYLGGDPLFLDLTDLDQNLDNTRIDTVLVTVISSTGDQEVLILSETEPHSGVFIGCIQSSRIPGPGGDGQLHVTIDGDVNLRYVDNNDPTDLASAVALFDPMGVVFDSQSGQPLDGTVITIIDQATNQPAEVYGEDGLSRFPSTVISGGSTTDSSGKVYTFPPGGYRFPLMNGGRYRLDIRPPQGHAAPSEVAFDMLQRLPGAPWELLEDGSLGQPFTLPPLPIFKVDLPVDPVENSLWTEKSTPRSDVSIGDFVPYHLKVTNSSPRGRVDNVQLQDRLPFGFRYQEGSAYLDHQPITPTISADGRTLTFDLGDLDTGLSRDISYVIEVAAGTRIGKAVNSATAMADNDLRSNTATATVHVENAFMSQTSFILGRVVSGRCDDAPANQQGVAGVRIYLEDGTYVVTDENGRYHFEGVEPGGHVVQIDPESYRDRYQAVICEDANQFARRAWSQFVDLQPGTLWRANFQLQTLASTPETVVQARPEPGHKPTKPEPQKGQLRFSLESDQNSDLIHLRLPIETDKAAASNVRITVILPAGSNYLPGSSSRNGTEIEDPSIMATALNYNLGDLPGNTKQLLSLKVKPAAAETQKAFPILAMLTLDSAFQANQRSGMLTLNSGQGDEAVSDIEIVSFAAIKDPASAGSQETTSAQPDSTDHPGDLRAQIFSDDYLQKATGGYDWLWPQEILSPAIPSIKVAVKHGPQQRVRLMLNNQPVSPLNFTETKQNSAATVAISYWQGVDLEDGENHLQIEVEDASGQVLHREQRMIHYSLPPVDAVLVPEQSTLVADSRVPAVLAIKLLDPEGYPARQGVVGEFRVSPPHYADDSHYAHGLSSQGHVPGGKSRFQILENGIARIAIAPTSEASEVEVTLRLASGEKTIRTWLKPAHRDWILVGFAEGTVGYNTFSGNRVGLEEAGLEKHYYDDGRVKFFAKGAIKGEWLLTMAYDSDKPDLDGDSLHQLIDPDTYYPLYGDSTQQNYEASSARKLYIKLERDQFYALFGDMHTGLTHTELSRYSRTMNGFKAEMQTVRFGYTLFAADTLQAFVKDEIRGDGTSGRYDLSQEDVVINSEEIVVETRDRFRSQLIIEATPMQRHIDYEIDYTTGSLFFKRPVPSKDENFNPVFIVARYEVKDSDEANFNYGGRAAVRILDQKVEIGASYIHEEDGASHGDLYGLDATVAVTPRTSLRLEAAATETEDDDGEANDAAYLAELEHTGERFRGLAYYREQGREFGLGQQNVSEVGTRRYGVEGDLNVSSRITLDSLAYRQDDLEGGGQRTVGEIRARYQANRYSLHTGFREARDRLPEGDTVKSSQWLTGGQWTTANRRLNLRLDYEQSLGSADESADFPTLLSLGADYALTKAINIFAEQEFTWGAQENTQGSRIGLTATPWQGGRFNSSVEHQQGIDRQRVFALFGLGQTWQVNPEWSVDLALDRSYTIEKQQRTPVDPDIPKAHGSGDDFTALSVGATYRVEQWTWWNRLETRQADSAQKYGVSTSVVGLPTPGVAVAAKALAFISDVSGGSRKTDANLRFGLAYRPEPSRWLVLNRLDFYFDQESGSPSDYDEWRIVNNLHANYRLSSRLQMSFYYGLKYTRTCLDTGRYTGFTDFLAFEARYNFNSRWDLGVHGSILHSWNSHQFKYNLGADVGYSPMVNTWVSLGYNLVGYDDRDFAAAQYTAQGAYLRFRAKFDQQNVREVAEWINR